MIVVMPVARDREAAGAPEVSLVMPVWKPEPAWFREAVGSALGQRGCSLEFIVVDDGNSVPVSQLLADVADPRLVIVRIAHGGVSRALNAGIGHARGEWIRFVGADDVLEPDSTARLVRLSGPERAIAYGSTLVCDTGLQPQRMIESAVQGEALLECLLGRFDVRIVSMLFPREVVAAAGPFDPAFEVNGDYDFVLRALEHAPVRGEQFVAMRYRRHGGSITAGPHAGKKRDLQALEKLLDRRPDLRGTRPERVARAAAHLNAARQLLLVGRRGAALREVAAALRVDPRRSLPAAIALAASAARRVPSKVTGPLRRRRAQPPP